MEKTYFRNSVNDKIMSDTVEFKEALLEVVNLSKSNIENHVFNGSILGEDLNSILSKHGMLQKMDWHIENGKIVIVLDYSFDKLDGEVKRCFDKYHLINFDILKTQLAGLGITILKDTKINFCDLGDGNRMLVPYTDKLMLTVKRVRKNAPLLKDRSPAYVRKLIKKSYSGIRYQ